MLSVSGRRESPVPSVSDPICFKQARQLRIIKLRENALGSSSTFSIVKVRLNELGVKEIVFYREEAK